MFGGQLFLAGMVGENWIDSVLPFWGQNPDTFLFTDNAIHRCELPLTHH
jgi:hypothetical protein